MVIVYVLDLLCDLMKTQLIAKIFLMKKVGNDKTLFVTTTAAMVIKINEFPREGHTHKQSFAGKIIACKSLFTF